jgi:hypothetical protein
MDVLPCGCQYKGIPAAKELSGAKALRRAAPFVYFDEWIKNNRNGMIAKRGWQVL